VVSFQQQIGAETFARRYRYESGQLYVRVPVYRDSGQPNSEFLYRTWYGERDCFPDPRSDQDRRDMLRLPSIYDQARIGAAGLALDESQTNLRPGETPAQMLQRFLYTQYANPSPNLDNPTFFTVTICSARSRRFSSDFTAILNNPDDPTGERLRYQTATDTNQFAFAQGACILRESPRTGVTEVLDQYGVPTMDAGRTGRADHDHRHVQSSADHASAAGAVCATAVDARCSERIFPRDERRALAWLKRVPGATVPFAHADPHPPTRQRLPLRLRPRLPPAPRQPLPLRPRRPRSSVRRSRCSRFLWWTTV
jgi:hypothetical protein